MFFGLMDQYWRMWPMAAEMAQTADLSLQGLDSRSRPRAKFGIETGQLDAHWSSVQA